jgi:hypothetical protein
MNERKGILTIMFAAVIGVVFLGGLMLDIDRVFATDDGGSSGVTIGGVVGDDDFGIGGVGNAGAKYYGPSGYAITGGELDIERGCDGCWGKFVKGELDLYAISKITEPCDPRINLDANLIGVATNGSATGYFEGDFAGNSHGPTGAMGVGNIEGEVNVTPDHVRVKIHSGIRTDGN